MSDLEDSSRDLLGYMAAMMAKQIRQDFESFYATRARAFDADRAWVAVDRDLDEAFLHSIGIRP